MSSERMLPGPDMGFRSQYIKIYEYHELTVSTRVSTSIVSVDPINESCLLMARKATK